MGLPIPQMNLILMFLQKVFYFKKIAGTKNRIGHYKMYLLYTRRCKSLKKNELSKSKLPLFFVFKPSCIQFFI